MSNTINVDDAQAAIELVQFAYFKKVNCDIERQLQGRKVTRFTFLP